MMEARRTGGRAWPKAILALIVLLLQYESVGSFCPSASSQSMANGGSRSSIGKINVIHHHPQQSRPLHLPVLGPRISDDDAEQEMDEKLQSARASQAEFEKHVQAVQKRRALLRLQNRRFMARIKPNQGWREERPPPVPLNKRTLAGFMNMEEAQEGQAIPPDATTTPPPSLSLPKNAKVDRRSSLTLNVYALEEKDMNRLRRWEYMPLAVWSRLADPSGHKVTYNAIRGGSQYVVVLTDTSTIPTNFLEGLKRMRIIPNQLASVVGITKLGPAEAGRLMKRNNIPFPVLSDPEGEWLRAYRVGLRYENVQFILEGKSGRLLGVFWGLDSSSVNDNVMSTIGDWRKQWTAPNLVEEA